MSRATRVWHPSATLESLEPRLLLDATLSGADEAAALAVFDAAPALFVENDGQWQDPDVRFAVHSRSANVALTGTGAVFEIIRPADGSDVLATTQFAVRFDGADAVEPVGLDPAGGVFNFYVGDEAAWRTGVAAYAAVAYPGLYDGIDLLTVGQARGLKYEFHVAARRDPAQIRLSYEGVDALAIDADGDLRIQTSLGELVDDAPYVYQDIGGERVEVPARFELIDADTYTLPLDGAYDLSAELVIDPNIVWGTYLGGSGDEMGLGIQLDGSGNYILTGTTSSTNLPATAGTHDQTYNGGSSTGWDGYVAKFTTAGQLTWCTYIGGSGDESPGALYDEASSGILLAGQTDSPNFPTTAGAYDTSYNGGQDVFLAKMNNSGQLDWATYLGGTGDELGTSVWPGSSGALYVYGNTASTDFPTAGGPYDATHNGGDDVFVAKMTSNGGMTWSTYLGGSGDEMRTGFSMDNSDNLYLAGYTESTDFPTAGGAYDASHNGGQDGFVTKMSSNGNVTWSTFFGGTANDSVSNPYLTDSGKLLLVGHTESADFPTTGGAYDTTYNGGTDIFMAEMNTGGSLQWSTFIGGSGNDNGPAVVELDGSGGFILSSTTTSNDFPVTAGAFDTTYNGGGFAGGDLYVAKLSASGQQLNWATYLGGSDFDSGYVFDVGDDGSLYLGGYTWSNDFPMQSAFDSTFGGTQFQGDGWVAKLAAAGNDLIWSSYFGGSASDNTVSFFRDDSGDIVVSGWTTSDDFPTTAGTHDQSYNGGTLAAGDAFLLKIEEDGGGPGPGPGPDVTISINDVSDTEGDTATKAFDFTVTLSEASTETVTVQYATTDGTAAMGGDYYPLVGQTLTFDPGVTTQTIPVAVIGDVTAEPDETFYVSLSNATNATFADNQGLGTILNDDAGALPTLSISDAGIIEGDSDLWSCQFTLTLSAASAQVVTVQCATADGTAFQPGDYVGINTTFMFNPGATVQTVTVPVVGDTDVEPDEIFYVNLNSPANATIADAQGIGTIQNDDSAALPTISISDAAVTEGNTGTSDATFAVTLSSTSTQTVTVNYATADGSATTADSDYTAANGTVTFNPGQLAQTVTVPVRGDTIVEPDETFYVNLSNAAYATVNDGQGAGTILNDDAQQLPDLTVDIDESKFPQLFFPGDKKLGILKSLPFTISNNGVVAAEGDIVCTVHISDNTVYDGPATDTLLYSGTVTVKLKDGKSKKYGFKKLVIPTLPAGNRYLILQIDTGNAIAESNELNNSDVTGSTIQWVFPAADLRGDVDTSKVQSTVIYGDNKLGTIKKVPVDVANSGNIDAVATIKIDLYASTNTTLDAGDWYFGTITVVIKLKVDKSKGYTFSNLVVPDLAAGGRWLLANLDVLNAVAESNELNNLAVSAGQIAWV